MEYERYGVFLFGGSFGLLLFVLLLTCLLPNRTLAGLFEKQFGIMQSNKEQLIVNFYGVEIKFLSSQRFRLSLVWQYAAIIWTVLVLFIDGCLFQVQTLSESEMCPKYAIDCFIYENIVSNTRITCNPGQSLSSWNSSDFLCFVWVYNEIRAIDVLNQMGIATGVFSLLCHSFKWLCCLSRKWFGLALIILILLASITSTILSYTGIIQISMIGGLLIMDLFGLLINVIQLRQYTYLHKRKVLLSK